MVKGCVRGNPGSQKRLYDTFSHNMYKVCLMYANDQDTANDLLQIGFLKVFQNMHKYDGNGALGGWIRRVIVNSCIDHYRSDKWSRNREKYEDFVDYNIEDTGAFNPDKIYAREDFLRITCQLPDGYRMILNLYFLEDLSHKEIAEQLKITEGTSKSQLFKAKKYLKQILLTTLPQEEIEAYGGFNKEVV